MWTKPLTLLIATSVTSAALAVATPTVASAATDDTVTSSEIAASLNATDSQDGSLVAEPVASATDTDSAAVTTQGDATIDVSKQPEDGVTLAAEGAPAVTVEVPNADTAGDARRLADGTVVYPGTDGSASAVIPTEAGAQMLTTIANRDAATRYDYKVTVPEGGRIVLTEGSAAVLDANGETVLAVPTPWAKDAQGAPVPTHFETDGVTLTQVVEHTSGDFIYPVVADPVWIVGAFLVAFTYVFKRAVIGCGIGTLQSSAYSALVYGWVWRDIVRAGRDGCVLGALGGFRGSIRRW